MLTSFASRSRSNVSLLRPVLLKTGIALTAHFTGISKPCEHSAREQICSHMNVCSVSILEWFTAHNNQDIMYLSRRTSRLMIMTWPHRSFEFLHNHPHQHSALYVRHYAAFYFTVPLNQLCEQTVMDYKETSERLNSFASSLPQREAFWGLAVTVAGPGPAECCNPLLTAIQKVRVKNVTGLASRRL